MDAEYKRYLRGEHWQSVRASILHRANGKCERCGRESDKLQVHHLTYRNLGHERYDELEAVCPKCHLELHGIKKKKFTKKAS